MKMETQRALVDEINKKTVEGKLKWGLVPGARSDFHHPDAEVDYYYCSDFSDTVLYLYELARAKPSPHVFQQIYRASTFVPEPYLVVQDQEDVDRLVLQGRRLLGDLMATVRDKAGSPESVAEDLMEKLRNL